MFKRYQNKKIAIYGLSILTRQVLTELKNEFQVIGLLDGYCVDGVLYDKPIISIEKAIQMGVDLILVAARPESCKIIAKRIERLCRKYHIDLLDISGNDLLETKKAAYYFRGMKGISKKELRQWIDRHETVSVDCFDTLVTRQTFFSTDVFELVDLRLRQAGIVIPDFCKKRLEGEKELCNATIPTLLEIYSYITDKYGITDIQPEGLAQVEWRVDCDLLVPRKELCALIQEVCQSGKPVFIVSDTFYTKEQLKELLKSCGITEFTDILTSCDYRTSKSQRLFEILQSMIADKNCIHIGDSKDADVGGAEKYGITGCQLYSCLELFENVGYLGLWEQINGLSSRVRAGMLISRLFNSPFQFEESDKKVHVDCAVDIGYIFFAPIITDFILWFTEQVKSSEFENVWFSARDGYLVKDIYDEWTQSTDSVYFLTSRIAAIRAGVRDEADIQYVKDMPYNGTIQKQLRERFGIFIENSERASEDLMAYKEEILKQAEQHRENYLMYVDKLGVKKGRIALFDFVGQGTVQMYLERLLDRKLKGFYFIRINQERMKEAGIDVQTFYQNEEALNSICFRNYFLIEAFMTSAEPSVIGFDSHGTAEYAEETRSEQEIQCIQAVQEGIKEYFRTYVKLCPELGGKSLGESMLSLLHGVSICDADFLAIRIQDPFFNRNATLLDLL